jgi:hypothetical protein
MFAGKQKDTGYEEKDRTGGVRTNGGRYERGIEFIDYLFFEMSA